MNFSNFTIWFGANILNYLIVPLIILFGLTLIIPEIDITNRTYWGIVLIYGALCGWFSVDIEFTDKE